MNVPAQGTPIQSGVQLVVERPNVAPVVEKTYAVSQSNQQVELRPVDQIDQNYAQPGQPIGTTQFNATNAAGNVQYNVEARDGGLIIRPTTNAGFAFAEQNQASVVGQAILEVQRQLSLTADQIKTIFVDLK